MTVERIKAEGKQCGFIVSVRRSWVILTVRGKYQFKIHGLEAAYAMIVRYQKLQGGMC